MEGFKGTFQQFQCDPCVQAKAHQAPVSSEHDHRVTAVLDRAHTDLCGSFSKLSFGKSKYFGTWIDDYSRFLLVFFLFGKDGTFKSFKDYVALCKQQLGKIPKILHSDRGGEYSSEEFMDFCKSHGIQQEFCASHTPQHNGVAERMNCTLCESALAMCIAANLSKMFWAEAIAYAAWIHNATYTRSVDGATPYKL